MIFKKLYVSCNVLVFICVLIRLVMQFLRVELFKITTKRLFYCYVRRVANMIAAAGTKLCYYEFNGYVRINRCFHTRLGSVSYV